MLLKFERTQSRIRLLQLESLEDSRDDIASSAPKESLPFTLQDLEDRLGCAGFITRDDRRRATRIHLGLLILSPLIFLSLLSLTLKHSPPFGLSLYVLAVGLSVATIIWRFYLRFRTKDYEREILFRLPLFLESLILVVESGLAVLPALEEVLKQKELLEKSDPVSQLFRMVYQLSVQGLPLEQSLEIVASHLPVRTLRHVMLHLDISANIGGELVPSLRNLSDHSHNDWRLSVEQRVRRLENLVVFPVFTAVLGMIALTAAVPLVPLLNLEQTLQSKQPLAVRQVSNLGGQQ